MLHFISSNSPQDNNEKLLDGCRKYRNIDLSDSDFELDDYQLSPCESDSELESNFKLSRNIKNQKNQNNGSATLQPKLKTRPVWEYKKFEMENNEQLPIKIGSLSYFDSMPPFNWHLEDTLIHSKCSGWIIPDLISKYFGHTIATIVEYEKKYERSDEQFCYLSIHQDMILPGQSQPNQNVKFHADGFAVNYIEAIYDGHDIDHTYIVNDGFSDEFIKGPFPISKAKGVKVSDVMNVIEQQSETRKIHRFPLLSILKLTPFTIHRTPINKSDKPVYRTMLKVHFTKREM